MAVQSAPGLVASRYQLVEKIGEGAMGVVYHALDRLTGDDVALKQVNFPAHQLTFVTQKLTFATRVLTRTEEKTRLALAREFRVLASLRHPNIISVLDYGFTTEHLPFFTMYLLTGACLLTEYGQTQPDEQKVHLLIEMLHALAYLHRHNLLHRDLKPANVLVNATGEVKVLDFGLSTQVEQAKGIKGTLEYMAPEVLRQQDIGPWSDLYAVGVMAYQLFTGEYPFAPPDPKQLISNILYQPPDVSRIPHTSLAAVIGRLLEKAPIGRYANADEVIVALSEAIGCQPPPESITIRESFLQAAQFVGRKNELARLSNALNSVIEGQRSAWLIGGESGVGKSRLVDELRTLALTSGMMVWRGQAVEDSGGRPYELWRDVLPHLALSADLSDLEAGILKAIVPDIDRLVGRDVPDIAPLNAPAQQQRLTLTILDILKRQERPLLLILEDLQWTSESRDLLRQILTFWDQLSGVMIVGTFRDDERPDLPDSLPEMQFFPLKRLSAPYIEELTTAMIGHTGQKPAVVQFLTAETEGNLFFLVETVRVLAEMAGGLEHIGHMTIPDSVFAGGVEQVIRRRLGRMAARFQGIQSLAAVLGREIDEAVLRIAIPSDLLDDWLLGATEAAVLEWQGGRWRFAHDKLREAVLHDIPSNERPALHRQAAEALEAVYSDDEAYEPVLLEHWYRAGDLEKEAYYADKVARFMIHVIAECDGVDQLLCRTLDKLPVEHPQYANLLLLRAKANLTQGKLSEAEIIAQQALDLARTTHDESIQAGCFQIFGAIKSSMGNYDSARKFFEQSLALYQKVDHVVGVAGIMDYLGSVAYHQGQFDQAQSYHQQGLIQWRKLGNQEGIGVAFNNLGNIAMMRGNYSEAWDFYGRTASIGKTIGSLRLQAHSLLNMGTCANELGQYAKAQTYYEQSYVLHKKIGNQRSVAFNLCALGETAERQDRFDQALMYYKESVTTAKSHGAKYETSLAYACLGGLQYKMQDNAARQSLLDALAIAHEIKAARLVLVAVLRMLQFMLDEHDTVRAAEIASLVQSHPSFDPSLQHDLDHVLVRLDDVLDMATRQVAVARGATLDLNLVAQELLDELGADAVD